MQEGGDLYDQLVSVHSMDTVLEMKEGGGGAMHRHRDDKMINGRSAVLKRILSPPV